VDHKAGDLRQSLKGALPEGADVVVDPVGGALSEPALRCLRWGGRFVTVGFAAGEIPRIPLNLVLLKGVHIMGFEFRGFGAHAAEEMARNDAEVLGLLGAKRALPHIGASFPLERAAEALAYVGAGRAIGKVILEVGTPA
jgi:NADPH2:quinone reductase